MLLLISGYFFLRNRFFGDENFRTVLYQFHIETRRELLGGKG